MIGGSPYLAAGYRVLKLEPHLHTVHSDGSDTIAAMFEACRAAGYDAVALTDHNTVAGHAEAREVAAGLGLIFVPGVEVTTFHGHAVVLGSRSVPEWRDLEARGMDALAADVHNDGGVLSVAHPAALGSPLCSGCAWDWPTQPASIDGMEVFSAARPHTAVPLALWRAALSRGSRVAPFGAGDVHSTAAAAEPRPATFVYAAGTSTAAVLDALRNRRLFASAGPPLDFWLSAADGASALAGERVTERGWTPHVSDPAATVREVSVESGERSLYAELRDPQDRLLALSAPIWITMDTSQ
ncbi:MAG TPA: CehA/McbA family metallohydrolase [Chloroflexota bacterium]|nr:CehA/McbA family metallohydrolase [Chloroflexota bacterium]